MAAGCTREGQAPKRFAHISEQTYTAEPVSTAPMYLDAALS